MPKNYASPAAGTLRLFGRTVNKYERSITPPLPAELEQLHQRPYFVYLEGGPGYGNREPQELPLTRFLLGRGYQVLYLDYRGTGLSTPINAEALAREGNPQAQADYLKLFRQDNIVRDLEAVRLCLTADQRPDRRQWSIFGQSFGGFVSLTYLSKYPQGLRESFITGGLAPVRRTAEEVYRATYRKVLERNQAYYDKYPEDVQAVRRVVEYITAQGGIALPGGGKLTAGRLLSVGMSLGFHGGLDSIHSLILKMVTDLDQFSFLTRSTLTAVELSVPFDSNPVYAILHEAIYCYQPGVSSNWAAYRVGREINGFSWLAGQLPSQEEGGMETPLCFAGEMVFPFHFETYPELMQMREAARLLAEYDGWEDLYDEEQLRRNEVPVYAASFVDDMYVDFDLARETAKLVRGIRVYETNSLYHNAIRARSEEVLPQLFKMRDDPVD